MNYDIFIKTLKYDLHIILCNKEFLCKKTQYLIIKDKINFILELSQNLKLFFMFKHLLS